MGSFAQIRQDEYPATADLQCIAVHIPEGDEYKALLAGFIAMLTNTANYEDPDSAQADGIAATFDEGYAQTNWDGCGVPPECQGMNTNVLLFGDTATVKTGNAIALVIDAAQRFNGYYQQNTAANGDKFSWTEFLSPGVWAYKWYYQRTTGSAQVNIKISDAGGLVENVTVDQFGATQANTVANGSFSLTVGLETEITMEVTGRNAGNTTNWLNRTIALQLWKVADL